MAGNPQHTKRYHKELKRVQNNLNQIIYRLANQLVEDCLFNSVSQLVIGWTISPDMNPHYSQLLSKLLGEMRQRAHKRGIQTHVIEEAYTSQTSCLDLDELSIIEEGYTLDDLPDIQFSGFRFDRDTYLSSQNKEIHADVNSSYNIMLRSQKSTSIPTLINKHQHIPRIIKPYIKYI